VLISTAFFIIPSILYNNSTNYIRIQTYTAYEVGFLQDNADVVLFASDYS